MSRSAGLGCDCFVFMCTACEAEIHEEPHREHAVLCTQLTLARGWPPALAFHRDLPAGRERRGRASD